MGERIFLLDFDGTLTRIESLPYIADSFALEGQMREQTQSAVLGRVPYEESLRERIAVLSSCPIDQVRDLIKGIPLHQQVIAFMQAHREQCCVVTSNLDLWCAPLLSHLSLRYHCSQGAVDDDGRVRLARLLDKVSIVRQWQEQGYSVVYLGDGANDYEAMRQADIGIAVGLVHEPAQSLKSVCQYVVREETELCILLEQLVRT